ncbi:putative glycosyl transferase [Planctomyces sp. SH-PL62]|nr:putative glycosyl transferase [Planctomyces sp. SH-PL62]
MQTPDKAIGWLPIGLIAALRALRRHQGRAIYSSAPFWTAHLIAMSAKKLTGRPWIADFRDPWRSNPFRRLPYQSIDRFDAWLESRVVRNADRIICNTRRMQTDFETRYPEAAGRFTTIYNGFDPEVYENLSARRPVGPDHLVITHAGQFYGPRRPHPIFEAIRLLRDRRSTTREPVLQLFGTPTYEGRDLGSIAAEFGIQDQVVVQGAIPHLRALEELRGSDIQLLVGIGGEGSDLQVPAKLYEYLGVDRPILALAPQNSAIADVMSEGGILGAICDPEDAEQIAAAIVDLDARALAGDGVNRDEERPAKNRFHRSEQVGFLVDVLEDVLRERESRLVRGRTSLSDIVEAAPGKRPD